MTKPSSSPSNQTIQLTYYHLCAFLAQVFAYPSVSDHKKVSTNCFPRDVIAFNRRKSIEYQAEMKYNEDISARTHRFFKVRLSLLHFLCLLRML